MNFEDLKIWQFARELTSIIYTITREGEFSRDFGLKDQIRRSSVSIMANIAEGFERRSDKEFLNFLNYAKASCGETRSHLYVALDGYYLSDEDAKELQSKFAQLSKMIASFMKTVASRI